MTTPMSATMYDDRICELGEGPLWHPERSALFWFDIMGKRLHCRGAEGTEVWQFDEHVSAAGWVDRDRLLIASETALMLFDLRNEACVEVIALEADDPVTRSNDGRADPMGGFWIGTMGKQAQPGAGAIYRYFGGELRKLHAGITIPNAICFAPDGRTAYFADTTTRQIMRQALDARGWPCEAPHIHIDLTDEGLNPDGAVVDAEGCLWNAQWGASRIARYAPDGRFMSEHPVPARQPSCPAFGGDKANTLFATTATEDLRDPRAGEGCVFRLETDVNGRFEPRVVLG
ncbi:SMP-30/gluconolactonase/LRE family protein [Celeribacter sp.]|uniref:SMP-30/gluconolactonase/LRE family protein n=1 Tax=Celeribacter sp. TaxID=1890673 RepID=UPI003A8F354C